MTKPTCLAPDQRRTVQFHPEHCRQTLLSTSFRTDEQQREQMLERGARLLVEIQARLSHVRAHFRQSHAGEVVEHGIGTIDEAPGMRRVNGGGAGWRM
jgi:hypothetical protein